MDKKGYLAVIKMRKPETETYYSFAYKFFLKELLELRPVLKKYLKSLKLDYSDETEGIFNLVIIQHLTS